MSPVRDTRAIEGAPDPEVERKVEELIAEAEQAAGVKLPGDVAQYRRATEAAIQHWRRVAGAWQSAADAAKQIRIGDGVEVHKCETKAGEALARAATLQAFALIGDAIVLRLAAMGVERADAPKGNGTKGDE